MICLSSQRSEYLGAGSLMEPSPCPGLWGYQHNPATPPIPDGRTLRIASFFVCLLGGVDLSLRFIGGHVFLLGPRGPSKPTALGTYIASR